MFHYTDSKYTFLFIIFIYLYIKQFQIVDRFMETIVVAVCCVYFKGDGKEGTGPTEYM